MQFDRLKRRKLITLLGSAAVAWPLAVRAQPREKVRRIGVLMPFAADDSEAQTRIGAFQQELQKLGWSIGGNLRIEYRWTRGNPDVTRKAVAELVALMPDVILSGGSVGALLEGTREVPIVFVVVPDPVAAGFVNSLARPGGSSPRATSCRAVV
jgi:putative ABC transport system substrate-binding protein